MKYVLVAAIAFAVLPSAARADWLDRAWDETGDQIAETGHPAITLTEGRVLLVLPGRVLADAHAGGMTTSAAVKAFMERYGEHCSDMIDLNQPQAGLQVDLFLQNPVSIEAMGTPDEPTVLDAMSAANPIAASGLRITNLFIVSAEHYSLTIDYVPQRKVTCVAPEDKIS